MSTLNFRTCLDELRITPTEAAQLLCVSPRTISRWSVKPAEIPRPAEHALRAWLRLNDLGVAWQPDGVTIGLQSSREVAEQIALYREHAIDLAALLERVELRGGPSLPWAVDLNKRRASLESMHVSFYPLRNGGFSPQMYSRTDDRHPDLERDRALLDDAYACIAIAIGKAGLDWHRQDDSKADCD